MLRWFMVLFIYHPGIRDVRSRSRSEVPTLARFGSIPMARGEDPYPIRGPSCYARCRNRMPDQPASHSQAGPACGSLRLTLMLRGLVVSWIRGLRIWTHPGMSPNQSYVNGNRIWEVPDSSRFSPCSRRRSTPRVVLDMAHSLWGVPVHCCSILRARAKVYSDIDLTPTPGGRSSHCQQIIRLPPDLEVSHWTSGPLARGAGGSRHVLKRLRLSR